MECHRGRHQQFVERLERTRRSECGQATVGFVLVATAMLVVVVVLGLLWRQIEVGTFIEHALASASHHVQMTSPGSVADVFLY